MVAFSLGSSTATILEHVVLPALGPLYVHWSVKSFLDVLEVRMISKHLTRFDP